MGPKYPLLVLHVQGDFINDGDSTYAPTFTTGRNNSMQYADLCIYSQLDITVFISECFLYFTKPRVKAKSMQQKLEVK